LVEIQTESYAWFLKTGIEEAFKDVFYLKYFICNPLQETLA